MKQTMRLVCIVVLFGLVLPVFGMTVQEFEFEVFRLTNIERENHSLSPLQYEYGLADIARMHSNNMLRFDYFSHKDHLGDEVFDRQKRYYPELVVASIGENIIKFNSHTGTFNPQELVDGWMNSEHHRKNILNPDYTHMGVGIGLSANTLYATQNFAKPLVKLRSILPDTLDRLRIYRISFEYMGTDPIKDLTCTLIYPDSEQTYQISDEQEMVGAQPIKIDWQDKQMFSVLVPFLAGRGDYQLCFGYKGNYFPEGILLRAR
nr:hypothetical protein [Candidatus Cloacimonadota bacterium]